MHFNFSNKYLFLFFTLVIVLFNFGLSSAEALPGASNIFNLMGGSTFLQSCSGSGEECLQLLQPLPGFPASIGNSPDVGAFVNTLFMIGIGVAGLLAVIMLIVAGFEYMSTDAISGKSEAKQRIGGAIFGLIIALGAFVILNTINPDLLNIGF